MYETLFDRQEDLFGYDLNRPWTLVPSIERFHKAVVKRYRETVQFRSDLADRRIDKETARQGFNILLRIFERLLGEGHVHYWLAKAYAKIHPEKSNNRFFVSFHFCAMDAAWHFLDIKNIDDWKDVSILNALAEPELLPWDVGPDEFVFVADRSKDRLPVLDKKYLSALQSEMKMACQLLTTPDPLESREISPGSPIAIKHLLCEGSEEILRVCDSDATVDDKMRNICRCDRRFLFLKSPNWSALLKVTDGAVRRTAFWKQDRVMAIEAENSFRETQCI